MKRLFLAVLGVSALSLWYFFGLSFTPDSNTEVGSESPKPTSPQILPKSFSSSSQVSQSRDSAVSSNPLYPRIEDRLAALRKRYPDRIFEAETVKGLISRPTAWRSNPQVSADLPLTYEQRSDGRDFIEFTPERIQMLLPGDKLELPLEQLGLNLNMRVDSIAQNTDGSWTWQGFIEDPNSLMRFVITQGSALTVAAFDTPLGQVAMQANGTQGWIATSETLFKRDPDKVDALYPPGHELNHSH